MGNKLTSSKTIKSGASDAEIKDFLKYVRPLDLLVFRGTEVFSKAIRSLEQLTTGSGEISHVEMCITREWCPSIGPLKCSKASRKNVTAAGLDDDRLLFSWGSTASGPLNDGVMNAETGKSKFGVQVRVLYDLVSNYLAAPGGNVGVCRLHDNPTIQRPREPLELYLQRKKELVVKLQKAYADYNGATYNANALALLAAIFPQLRGIHNTSAGITAKFMGANKWLFCSEFVATVYIDIGVISDATDGEVDGKTLDPGYVVPVDFIGFDADPDGIRESICDKPRWIKPLTTTSRDQQILQRVGTVCHIPMSKLNLSNPLLTPAESSASMTSPITDQHGYKISPSRALSPDGQALSAAAAALRIARPSPEDLSECGSRKSCRSDSDRTNMDTRTDDSSSSGSSLSRSASDAHHDAHTDDLTEISASAPPFQLDSVPAAPSGKLSRAHTQNANSAGEATPLRPNSQAPSKSLPDYAGETFGLRSHDSARPESARKSARPALSMTTTLSATASSAARPESARKSARAASSAARPESSRKPDADDSASNASSVSCAVAGALDNNDAQEDLKISIVDQIVEQQIEDAKPKKARRIRRLFARNR